MIHIDGHICDHKDSELSTGDDGKYPPFYLFDAGLQEHISGPILTRLQAERLQSFVQPFRAHDPYES